MSGNSDGKNDGAVSGDVAQRVALDVGNGVAPRDSVIHYGPEELAFRRQLERELAEYRRAHPGAVIDARD